MPLISVETAKNHLRVIHDAEDQLIQLYVNASVDSVTQYIQRAVYETQVALDAARTAAEAENPPADFDAHAMVINDAIRAAALLRLGVLYESREDVVNGVSTAELPWGSKSLLAPYRVRMGV